MDERPLSFRQFVQLAFSDAKDAAIAPEPQIAVVILQNLRDGIVAQSLPRSKAGRVAVFPTIQAAAAGANPERVFFVQMQRGDVNTEQAVRHITRPAAIAR